MMNADNTESPNKEVKLDSLSTTGDLIAEKESGVLDENAYTRESKRKAHGRRENLKNTLHIFVMAVVIIAALLLICGVVIWAWHILMPLYYHWLTTEQIYEMQKIMSSILLAIVISDYAKKYFH